MSQLITLRPKDLEFKQIGEIAAALTGERCEYGERYTHDQVRQALWRAVEYKIDTLLENLDELTNVPAFSEYLGEPAHFDDPRAARCAACGHPREDHIDGVGCGYLPKSCECAAFVESPPEQITFTNFDPRVYDGLGEIRWVANKRCDACGHTKFYIQTTWYDGCCREKPLCVQCDTAVIGLPVDETARQLVLEKRSNQ